MADPLPPDPYIALGVAKDATAAAIKTQYRKLVLKFHPDKVQDETQKQAAADQFHKIQTAYEIVSDEARRARYDAQCKLAELRKDVMDRDRGGWRHSSDDDRNPRYAPQQEPARDYPPRERGPRVSPQYSTEERRPGYAQQDYFDPQPRATARKDPEYERASRRTPPREEKKSSKASSVGGRKKDERSSRKKESKKSDREVRQDRQRKMAASVLEEESSSDSDRYDRRRREAREEELRKVREQYMEHTRLQREQAEQGYFGDERTRKLFSQSSEARDYIGRSGRTPRTEEPERKPSPVRVSSSRDRTEQKRPSTARMSSSKEQVEYMRRDKEGPPVMIRRGSGRPQTTGRNSERRTREAEVADEPIREAKRTHPPPLAHAKSSPPIIQPEVRSHAEKPRSHSVQVETERDEPPMPKIRRAETAPYGRHKETKPERSSGLRHSAYPTPESSPERQSRKFNYGAAQAYADDEEYASPDGYEIPASSGRYETEERKPTQRGSSSKRDRHVDEPVPVAKDARDSRRSASTKHAAQPPSMPPRSNSMQYVYRDGQDPYVRPGPVREPSRGMYFGEIPTTTSSRTSPGVPRSRHSPPIDESAYKRNLGEPVTMQSGFSTKTRERPSMSRRDTRQRGMV